MNISKEYLVEQGIVVLTVENPPLPTTKHTIVAAALADGTVVLEDEIQKLRDKALEALNVHNTVTGIING